MTHLGRLILITGAIVSVVLGVRLPIRKGEKFLILPKVDVGTMFINVTAEFCDDSIKLLNIKVKQTSYRPPVISIWVRFISKLDVISVDFTSSILLDGQEIITIRPTNYLGFYKKYLPIFANEIYSFKGDFKNVGLASLPKGNYKFIFKGVNQDEQQVVCIHLTGFVEN